MKKALLKTGLVVALLLSTAFPASAVSMETLPDSEPETVEGTAGTPENKGAESNIAVDVPSKAEFTLNPYRIAVDTPDGPTQETVICKAKTLVSRTAAPLSVAASVSGETYADSDLSLAASFDELNPNAKTLFLWFEFVSVTDGAEPVWSGEYTGARNQIVVNGGTHSVCDLPASENGEPVEVAFRAFGVMGIPSEEMWTSNDGIDVSLSFEFETIKDAEATLCGVIFADEDIPEPSGYTEGAEASSVAGPVDDAAVSDEIMTLTDETTPLADMPFVADAEMFDDTQHITDMEASNDTEPVEDAEPSDDTEPVENTEPSDITKPVENPEPFNDMEPVEDAEPSDVAEPVEDTQSSEDTEPVEDAEPSEDTESVEDAEPSDDTEPVEDVEPSDVAEPVEDVEPSDVAEPVEDTQPSDAAETVADAEPSEDMEPVEDAEASDVAEPVEDAKASEDTEPVEDEQPSVDTESAKDAKPSDVTESVEASEDTEPVEDEQPSDDTEPVEDAADFSQD